MKTTSIHVVDSSASLHALVGHHAVPDALRALHAADIASGFVRDSGDFEYYQLPSGNGRPPFFLQFNSGRAERPREGGSSSQCPLCFAEVKRRRQAYVTMSISGRQLIALSNPYPFMPTHITVASTDHEPQTWNTKDSASQAAAIAVDVVSLANALPGFRVIYNGTDAGATIPLHRHYQVFALPDEHGPLPLETAADNCTALSRSGFAVIPAPGCFPLSVFLAVDAMDHVIAPVADLLVRWRAVAGVAASANLIASSNQAGTISVYIVPRHRLFCRAVGFAGVLGSLETCGIFVLSTDSERHAITAGQVTHSRMWRALEALRPPQLASLLT